MDEVTIAAYIEVVRVALALGEEVVDAVRAALQGHAQAKLTPEEYAQLQQRWHTDALRAAANAGIDPETGIAPV